MELRGDNLRVLVSTKWMGTECLDGETTLDWQTPPSPNFNQVAAHNPDRTIARFRFHSAVRKGDPIRFVINAIPDRVSGAALPIWLAPRIAGAEREGPATLTVHAGPARALRVIARPAPEEDGRIRVAIQPQDAYGYPTHFARPVPITITNGEVMWEDEAQDPQVLYLDPTGNGIVRFVAHVRRADIPPLDAIENGTGSGEIIRVVSNPVWSGHERGQIPAFGAIHWHTHLSGDGMRSLDQAFTAGRDHVNLDFAAPGDHTPKGDKWRELVHACDRYNEPGVFATMYGWELSSNEGHVNFYFTDPNHRMNPDHFNYPTRPAQYIETLPHEDFLAIPHHTNAVSYATRDDGSHYWHAYPWGEPRDAYLRLVEIFQGRGNFEREDPPDGWRTVFRNNGGSVQTALAKGHRLGFVGGTDNHVGWPARQFSRLQARPTASWIFTGAWTAARTREAVYDALCARHTWACWGTRAIVRFTVGGALQGDELRLPSPRALTARIHMSVEQPLDVLEIVSEDDASIPVDVSSAGLDIDADLDLGHVGQDTFFYLRARQADGALIYASPVFIVLE